LNRPKQGFSSALPYILQEQYAHLYGACLRKSLLARDGVLDGAVMSRLVDEHTAQRADHGNRLWLLINAEVWYRMMILGQSREDVRLELASPAPARRAAVAGKS
jgi:asparagine synthase (glutamine-hydrolysing)